MFHSTLKIRCSQDKKTPLSAEEQKEFQKLQGDPFGVSKSGTQRSHSWFSNSDCHFEISPKASQRKCNPDLWPSDCSFGKAMSMVSFVCSALMQPISAIISLISSSLPSLSAGGEIEIYKAKLRTEFGYSNKDIKADPDLQEMESRIAAFQKRSWLNKNRRMTWACEAQSGGQRVEWCNPFVRDLDSL